LYVTDVFDSHDKNADFVEKVNLNSAPLILIINKIDLIDQTKLIEFVDKWKLLLPRAEIFPVSALHKFNIENLFGRIKELLPESPPFFDKDQLTDKPERFFVTEIVREKILTNYDKEIPYSTEVVVENYKEETKIIRINAVIYVERDSQKAIIIGKGGKSLKKVGMEARRELETFFEKPIFLELFVKVEKDWRNKPRALGQFGYEFQ
ncbi:MAG: GTPase Era, partial [Paludibacter sp.]|nr:GTPase Era [Paludibacter sp.]